MIIKKQTELFYNNALKKISKMFKKQTTTNTELDNAGNVLFGLKYIGTFPSDMAKLLENGESMILNTESSDKSGEHWVAFFREKNTLLGYDSFGRDVNKLFPTLKNTFKGLKIMNTEHDAEQKDTENNCGSRSLAFLYIAHKYGIKYARWI